MSYIYNYEDLLHIINGVHYHKAPGNTTPDDIHNEDCRWDDFGPVGGL